MELKHSSTKLFNIVEHNIQTNNVIKLVKKEKSSEVSLQQTRIPINFLNRNGISDEF